MEMHREHERRKDRRYDASPCDGMDSSTLASRNGLIVEQATAQRRCQNVPDVQQKYVFSTLQDI